MEIIKWIIKPLIRLHKWVNRWVWPIVLLICSAVAIVLGLVKLHPQALVIGAVGVALSVINLRRAIKRLKAGKGSEDSSGSLPPAAAQDNSEW